jgi:hypothetical protein
MMTVASTIPAPVLEWAASANDILRLSTEDVLILTGSAVLPFTTGSDDIDLVLLTSAEDRLADFAAQRSSERRSEQVANGYTMCYFNHRDVEVDLEVWPLQGVRQAIAALPSGIATIDEIESDFTRVGGLEVKVGTDLLHGLMLGRPIHGIRDFAALREAIPWRCYLAWKRDALLVNVRDATKGIPASLRADRPDEAFMKLCWAADSAVDALVFHSGLSINRWKWRLRYLPVIDEAIATWYREVRFSQPLLTVDSLQHQVDVLREIWLRYAGTEPQPARLPGIAD